MIKIWLIIGVVFAILEILTVNFLFLFFSISAFLVSLILFIAPEISLNTQIIMAIIFSLISCFIWGNFFRNKKVQGENINNIALRFLDKKFVLDSDVVNGSGTLQIGDTLWKVETEEALLTKGTLVRVIAVNDGKLQISKLEN